MQHADLPAGAAGAGQFQRTGIAELAAVVVVRGRQVAIGRHHQLADALAVEVERGRAQRLRRGASIVLGAEVAGRGGQRERRAGVDVDVVVGAGAAGVVEDAVAEIVGRGPAALRWPEGRVAGVERRAAVVDQADRQAPELAGVELAVAVAALLRRRLRGGLDPRAGHGHRALGRDRATGGVGDRDPDVDRGARARIAQRDRAAAAGARLGAVDHAVAIDVPGVGEGAIADGARGEERIGAGLDRGGHGQRDRGGRAAAAAIEGLRAGARRIEPVRQPAGTAAAAGPAHGKAAVVVLEVVAAQRGAARKETHHAFLRVVQAAAGGPALGGAEIPVQHAQAVAGRQDASTPEQHVLGGDAQWIVLEADALLVARGMVQGESRGWGRAAAIPTRPVGLDAGGERGAQLQQGEVTGLVGGEQRGATGLRDRVAAARDRRAIGCRTDGAAGRAFVLPVQHRAVGFGGGADAVVGGREQPAPVLRRVVEQLAGAGEGARIGVIEKGIAGDRLDLLAVRVSFRAAGVDVAAAGLGLVRAGAAHHVAEGPAHRPVAQAHLRALRRRHHQLEQRAVAPHQGRMETAIGGIVGIGPGAAHGAAIGAGEPQLGALREEEAVEGQLQRHRAGRSQFHPPQPAPVGQGLPAAGVAAAGVLDGERSLDHHAVLQGLALAGGAVGQCAELGGSGRFDLDPLLGRHRGQPQCQAGRQRGGREHRAGEYRKQRRDEDSTHDGHSFDPRQDARTIATGAASPRPPPMAARRATRGRRGQAGNRDARESAGYTRPRHRALNRGRLSARPR